VKQAPIVPNLPLNHDYARVIQVVETTLTRRGSGTPDSVLRIITQYWSMDGELLAEVDPCPDEAKPGMAYPVPDR
jgi:hypothetical protein